MGGSLTNRFNIYVKLGKTTNGTQFFSDEKEAEKLITKNKGIGVKLTIKNRGACFLDEPPKINKRRYSELPASTSQLKNPTVKPDMRPINGKCNWRKQKLTFEVVDRIENIKLVRTPEILKPCWLQRKGLKKRVQFDMVDIKTDSIPQKMKELPPPSKENIEFIDTSIDLLKSILSWKPACIKEGNHEFDSNDTQETLDFFQTICQFKK